MNTDSIMVMIEFQKLSCLIALTVILIIYIIVKIVCLIADLKDENEDSK